ncbi:heme ABC transporter ATP-binding protein/permease CydC [Otariodibacter oris]|uniref:Glutathione/L-cysteine transport system ATP-binding/permease protein CydC n=1 Tax=Otariodibacter oris TaxID=1032623 RepID=A0A420XFP1_9PAST|nr:cysteine/glutathione ABC transporter ATP-binding protein/permease CydC [Otariodibacter oris]QGM80252.1 cysteine/glutathione ABC transporter ATP-binding protein/permease CydC [Otariodibacter oris]RKR71618.1 ATP-binding cassette subfamily C protein CydC [Otariodibacter oris]
MRSLFPFLSLYRHHLGQLVLGIVLAITSLTASIGLLSLSGWFLSAAFLAGSSILFNFFYPSAGVRGLAIGRTVSRYIERLVTHDATFRVLASLRVAVFQKLVPLTPSKLAQYRHSELLNRLVADVDTLDTLYLNLISPFVSAIMVIAFMGIGLSFISPLLAWTICSILVVLLLLLPTIFYHLGRKLGKKVIQYRANYRSQFIEWIELNAEFLLFGVLDKASNKLQETEREWIATQRQERQLAGLSNAILIAANGFLIIIVLYLLATAVSLPNVEHQGALIALVIFCVLASLEVLMPIGAAFLHLGQVIAAAERLTEITEQAPLVKFEGKQQWQNIVNNQPLVSFNNVQFSYPNRDEVVLNDITFEILAGQKIAILGKTGSGKSTIFQLLVRNYDPTSGQIRLNSCNIQDYPEEVLRQHIVTLTQRVHIFSNTLKENLLIGNAEATEDELRSSLNKVGLGYLLNEKEGLDLWLGDGGRPLSGGEQRRLGVARILLNSAEIVLLDEPTEGLDRDTEQQILKVIFEHCQNKTLVVITHRLSGLEKFDHIYNMNKGTLSVP